MLPLSQDRVRALAVFYAGGGLLCLSALVLPQGDRTHVAGIAAVGLLALVTAAGLHRWSALVPAWVFHTVVLLGNVLITVVVVLAGPGTAAATWAIMYTWAPVHTAAYCRRHEFAAHTVSTVLLHGLALAIVGEGPEAGTRVLLVTATALVVSSVVGSLVVRIRQLAGTDALTGLANRRTFESALQREHALTRRRGRPLSVVMLDLDGFKQFNDQHGHADGDDLLCRAATAWRGQLRGGDMLARMGGDEFALLLPDCSVGDAHRIGRELIAATPAGVGASVGVAVVPPREPTAHALAEADAALYASKRRGGGVVAAAEPVAG